MECALCLILSVGRPLHFQAGLSKLLSLKIKLLLLQQYGDEHANEGQAGKQRIDAAEEVTELPAAYNIRVKRFHNERCT